MDEVKFGLKPVEMTERVLEKGDNIVTWIVFDTSKQGLETLMKDYQEMCMRFLWERGRGGRRKQGCLATRQQAPR